MIRSNQGERSCVVAVMTGIEGYLKMKLRTALLCWGRKDSKCLPVFCPVCDLFVKVGKRYECHDEPNTGDLWGC